MKKTLVLIFSLMTLPAWAFTPESGWWWNPDEPGTGFAIEIQDDKVFAAFYVYDDLGNPIWYTAVGDIQGNSYFDNDRDYTFGGTCIDCSYTTPTTLIGDGGPVTIDFLTETTATIQFGGSVKHIERYNFFLGDELEKMRGEWQVVYDVSEFTNNFPFIADVLIFRQTEVFQGDYLVTGCRSESTSFNTCTNYALNNNDMAAYYDTDFDELVVVVRDDDDYYLAFYLKTGLDQFDGEAYSYLVGSSPNFNENGFPVRGFRSASYTFVATGTGPSKSEATEQDRKPGISTLLDKKPSLKKTPMDQAKADRLAAIVKKLEAKLGK